MTNEQHNQARTLDDAEAHMSLGNAFINQGKYEDAATQYEKAIMLKPDYADAYNSLANILKRTGRLDAAVAKYTHAIALKPDYAAAYSNLGSALREQGKFDDAIIRYEQAIALKPGSAQIHFNLGIVLMDHNKPESAIDHFRRCLELDPLDHYGARLLLAKLGCEVLPARASEAHLQQLYNKRAHVWDRNIDAFHPYKGHELVTEALS